MKDRPIAETQRVLVLIPRGETDAITLTPSCPPILPPFHRGIVLVLEILLLVCADVVDIEIETAGQLEMLGCVDKHTQTLH